MATVLVVAGLLVSTAYLQELQAADGSAPHRDRGPSPDAVFLQQASHGLHTAAVPRKALRAQPLEQAQLAPATLETISIVLPCAFEGNFASQTVEALWQHTNHGRLWEILVIDDGSKPALSTTFPTRLLAGSPGAPPCRIIRHERTLGLIAAKKTGGDAARGDVIVFFDCHVSPRDGWEEAFFRQMKRAGDHRTVVVPTITSLDPDTWKEIPDGANGQACYILWNADFTWLANPGRDVPLMSGGLLAISRRWWQETGGYDEHMVAWGGENIDQSLRVWLCGGRIEVAEGAYVAHMWRDPKNAKTMLKYPIPTDDVMRNKARAAAAWFGDFKEKVFGFPEYENFLGHEERLGDMGNFRDLKSRLKCAPFSAYLNRFSYVYFDTGYLPTEVFQIREAKTGLCLERVPPEEDGQTHTVALVPCSGGEGGGPVSELQVWHPGNRNRAKEGEGCCSGIMNWNFNQCLDGQGIGSKVQTFECEISGGSANQFFDIDDEVLYWRKELKGPGAEGCIEPLDAKVGDVDLSPSTQCTAQVVPIGSETLYTQESLAMPASFRLQAAAPGADEDTCATVAPVGEGISDFKMEFRRCDPDNPQQVFQPQKSLYGAQIRVGQTGNCLDTAGGTQLLVYPCYEETAANMNQVWTVEDGKLLWRAEGQTVEGSCASFKAAETQTPVASLASFFIKGQFELQTCVSKTGQLWRRHDLRGDGTFLLLSRDSGQCLVKSGRIGLGYGACGDDDRWRELKDREQVQHVGSTYCIDSGDRLQYPTLYDCHQPKAMQSQRFHIVEPVGWLQNKPTWFDNGRKRIFEKCVDGAPAARVEVAVQHCDAVRRHGVRWERHNSHEPIERRLWEASSKSRELIEVARS